MCLLILCSGIISSRKGRRFLIYLWSVIVFLSPSLRWPVALFISKIMLLPFLRFMVSFKSPLTTHTN